MPDYGSILRFLAENPPQHAAERDLHASLLELLASCLRNKGEPACQVQESAAALMRGLN